MKSAQFRNFLLNLHLVLRTNRKKLNKHYKNHEKTHRSRQLENEYNSCRGR